MCDFEKKLEDAVKLVTDDEKPNINALWMELKELNAIKWSMKQQGYAIGSEVFKNISATKVPLSPTQNVLLNKCSTQEDIESDWFRFWINELKSAPLPHRKLWEFAYILQNLYSLGALQEGNQGLGFGCGEEPLPSYFASKGVSVTVTDLDPEMVAGMGWVETGQHTDSLEKAFAQHLVDKPSFERLVDLQYVDMNNIPSELDEGFDFCWSVCALEHLGSIQQGLDFIENSLKTLKPGGVAVHTTEFNYTEQEKTIDNWMTVLFLRKHFEELSVKLRNKGYRVMEFDFDIGEKPLDTFIDLPPYAFSEFLQIRNQGDDEGYRPGHLKLSVDGFPSTCIAMTIKRP